MRRERGGGGGGGEMEEREREIEREKERWRWREREKDRKREREREGGGGNDTFAHQPGYYLSCENPCTQCAVTALQKMQSLDTHWACSKTSHFMHLGSRESHGDWQKKKRKEKKWGRGGGGQAAFCKGTVT